ncbi:hypothetical protein SASPL_100570 [Salvia splendens]|uniref:Tryptophan N-monooxygenase n=1 Tax=Salvia splendens TaxID=180675 RepID=A0A8X8YT67_SALSN|nr:hypothetical protein SASPL_100570 [Salvia splendens]
MDMHTDFPGPKIIETSPGPVRSPNHRQHPPSRGHTPPLPRQIIHKYGPVISLKLGSITTVVISSAETAKLVLQKLDSSFSNRTIPLASKALHHDEFSVPVGNQWRKLRKICREQMFSAPRLDASEGLRREKLRDYVAEHCDPGTAVDVGDASFTTALNLKSAEFARFDLESSQQMKEVISRVVKSVSSPNLADYFPQGIYKETELNVGRLFAKLDEIIDEKLRWRGEKPDLVEVLLEINQRDEAQLTRDDIRHLLLVRIYY